MGKTPVKKNESSSSTEITEREHLADLIDRQIGDLVSQKQREVIVSRVTSLVVSESFSGPIAHPKHLRGYEETVPGSADRIIAMAENQQRHHMQMDQNILKAEIADRKLGMWLGAAAFIFLVVCALITSLVLENSVVPGLFLGSAALGAVGLFIRGRQNGK